MMTRLNTNLCWSIKIRKRIKESKWFHTSFVKLQIFWFICNSRWFHLQRFSTFQEIFASANQSVFWKFTSTNRLTVYELLNLENCSCLRHYFAKIFTSELNNCFQLIFTSLNSFSNCSRFLTFNSLICCFFCSTRNCSLFNSVSVLRLLTNHFARFKFVFYSLQFLFCSCQQINSRYSQLFIKLLYLFSQAVMSFFHQLIKYRTASKLTIINNEIAIKNRQFENTVIIVEWCKNVKDDETQIEKLKVVKDLVLKQQKMLKNFAAEFMQYIQHDSQFSTIVRHELEW